MAKLLTEAHLKQAASIGVKPKTVMNRVYNLCWEVERAISTPTVLPNHHWIEWKDKSVVHKTTFYQRIQRGMTPEQAATTPQKAFPKTKRKNAIISEETFALALQNGVKRSTLHCRVNTLGWPLEEAITTPPMPKTMKRKKKKGGWY